MPGQEVINPVLGNGVLDPGARLQCLNRRTNTVTGK